MTPLTRFTLKAALALAIVAALLCPASGLRADPVRVHHRHRDGPAGRRHARRHRDGDQHRHRPQASRPSPTPNGTYTFRNLPPGIYDLSASLEGFRALNQTGLRVSAGNPVRVDLKLEVGALAETVNVVSETTLLQTEKADLSTELTSKEIVNLPLNQFRNYQTLLNLVPGATPAQFQNAEIDTPGRSLRTWVNGVQPNSNTTRIDGAVSVNVWLPHHAGYVASAETIDTVNIATNNFDADQGMAGGAATTVITKSGTNELHGSAFLFHNNDGPERELALQQRVRPAEAGPEAATSTAPPSAGRSSRTSCSSSGPGSATRATTSTTQTYGVPTAKMRAGDFSEVAAAYSSFKLYNPFTGGAGGVGREQFANYTIPGEPDQPASRRTSCRTTRCPTRPRT